MSRAGARSYKEGNQPIVMVGGNSDSRLQTSRDSEIAPTNAINIFVGAFWKRAELSEPGFTGLQDFQDYEDVAIRRSLLQRG